MNSPQGAPAPTWNDPATWAAAGWIENLADPEEQGCIANPEVAGDRCCAYHHWTGLMMRPYHGRDGDDTRNADVVIGTEAHNIVLDPQYGEGAYDAAASFVAHALGQSGCGDSCACPAGDRARAFAAILPEIVAHAFAGEIRHEGNSHVRCLRCPAGLPPLPPVGKLTIDLMARSERRTPLAVRRGFADLSAAGAVRLLFTPVREIPGVRYLSHTTVIDGDDEFTILFLSPPFSQLSKKKRDHLDKFLAAREDASFGAITLMCASLRVANGKGRFTGAAIEDYLGMARGGMRRNWEGNGPVTPP